MARTTRAVPKTFEAGLLMDELEKKYGHGWRDLPDTNHQMIKLRALLNFRVHAAPGPDTYQVGIYKYGKLVEVVDSVHVIARRLTKSPATIKNYCYSDSKEREGQPISYRFIKERGIYENGKLSE